MQRKARPGGEGPKMPNTWKKIKAASKYILLIQASTAARATITNATAAIEICKLNCSLLLLS
ncbi:MAG: hypothetical protein DA405_07475 [Bacteroidetes bacterium]|nr:MAG: hypothetical protein DA405_07475 [Bacteroidota bacterium]